ncbi:MAG: hypothetical protein M1820_002599 [Bogoriella megaspora]|nr:MAG: hypothetical protein M1820_002599 [Bogoriella megaspora]
MIEASPFIIAKPPHNSDQLYHHIHSTASEHLNVNMTESGSFIKVPTDEEEKRMREAAEASRQKREEAKKQREALKAAEKAGKASQERREKGK